MIELEIDVNARAGDGENPRDPVFIWARVGDDGAVSALEPERRIVLRLKPPPPEKESPWRIIERLARAVAEASETGR